MANTSSFKLMTLTSDSGNVLERASSVPSFTARAVSLWSRSRGYQDLNAFLDLGLGSLPTSKRLAEKS